NHSNIVQIYEVGNIEGVHYIAMEYVQGKSLRRVIDRTDEVLRKHLPTPYIVQVIVELCAGLSFAHDARHLSGAPMGLIHRDINPHNVLISYRGEVKVIDFGIAKSELTMEKTQAGTIKGTVVYMSPEQSSGHKLDKRSDIFAVGICLYEALTGLNPFHKDTLGASLEAIRRAEVPPLTTGRPELAPFAPIVAKALARAPDDRYTDCNELASALRALQDHGVVPKPPIPFGDFLDKLFRDDIEEEERLLSQTELAEMPTMGGPTETIPALAAEPQASVVLSGSRTIPEAGARGGRPKRSRDRARVQGGNDWEAWATSLRAHPAFNYAAGGVGLLAVVVLSLWLLRPTPTPTPGPLPTDAGQVVTTPRPIAPPPPAPSSPRAP
ncbi:MAG TPA: serine/threonine-protein kinase, partial [Myxococcota bacterium]|nr:serine/threonine-protein kinase [Myxococcota bacterium]